MLKFKKSIASYLIILFVFSLIISLFLFFVLEGFYGKTNIKCKSISYEVNNICFDIIRYKFNFKNLGNSSFIVSFDKKYDFLNNRIFIKKSKNIYFKTKSKSVNIIPVIKENGNTFYCNSKLKVEDLTRIKKC